MMLKLLKETYYILLAGLVLCLLSSRASADSVILNFTGTIQAGVCGVDVNSVNQSIPMGTVGTQAFGNPGDRSTAVPFSITLNCPQGGPERATVTFSGIPSAADSSLLALDNDADMASGVAVLLADKDGNKINLGTASAVYTMIADSSNVLQFTAQYTSTVDRAQITAGTANATAQFTINYP